MIGPNIMTPISEGDRNVQRGTTCSKEMRRASTSAAPTAVAPQQNPRVPTVSIFRMPDTSVITVVITPQITAADKKALRESLPRAR